MCPSVVFFPSRKFFSLLVSRDGGDFFLRLMCRVCMSWSCEIINTELPYFVALFSCSVIGGNLLVFLSTTAGQLTALANDRVSFDYLPHGRPAIASIALCCPIIDVVLFFRRCYFITLVCAPQAELDKSRWMNFQFGLLGLAFFSVFSSLPFGPSSPSSAAL